MSKKVILCRCEDVTLTDVQRALASGFDDLEEVKRYTGFGTGPCQGKECLRAVALAIAEASGRDPTTIHAFTTRPPLVPTELKYFVGPPRPPTAPADDDAWTEPGPPAESVAGGSGNPSEGSQLDDA